MCCLHNFRFWLTSRNVTRVSANYIQCINIASWKSFNLMNSCAVYSGVHAELSIFCCSLYELGYVTSNATRGCTEGYSKVITQEEAPSSPHCLDGASGSLVLPDESENTSDDNPGKLQVHVTVMCMEIQALQQTS